MADDPNKTPTPKPGANPAGPPPAGKPAPGAKTDNKAAPAGGSGGLPADALSDGTVPTVLAAGQTHKSVAKGKASITTVYRKADIMTTLLTFAGAIIAALIIFAAYAYFTRSQPKTVKAPSKVTSLNQSDINKLGAFFNGNSAGTNSEILTVSSSSLFKNRVAVDSDLKVTGGLSVTGPTSLGALTVAQTTTLGVTDIHGQLVVSGPLVLQSPAQLEGGASVTGNVAATGNGTFGGSISAGVVNVATISVTTINLAGHLNITGATPTTSGSSISGNDSAGTVTVTTGTVGAGNSLVTVTFHSAYPTDPVVMITPIGAGSAQLDPFVLPGASSFTIGAGASHVAGSFSFNYWVVQ